MFCSNSAAAVVERFSEPDWMENSGSERFLQTLRRRAAALQRLFLGRSCLTSSRKVLNSAAALSRQQQVRGRQLVAGGGRGNMWSANDQPQ